MRSAWLLTIAAALATWHQVWIDCGSVAGKRLADAKQALRAAWADAAKAGPCVLVLDRLHLLTPKPLEGPHAGSPADVQASVLADVVDDLMTAQALSQAEAAALAEDGVAALCKCEGALRASTPFMQ